MSLVQHGCVCLDGYVHDSMGAMVQPASGQCDVGPVCVPIELVSTYFNLP